MAVLGKAQITLAKVTDGTSVTIKSKEVVYQNSTSGTEIPTSVWSDSPNPTEGEYMWTRTTVVYSDSTSTVGYSVSYIGKDGSSTDTMLAVKQYTLQDTAGLTTEALESLPNPSWVDEELVTWSYGKFLYSRYKKYNPSASMHWMDGVPVAWGDGEFFFYRNKQYDSATYTYIGREEETENWFIERLKFELTVLSSTYIVNKRISGTNAIILRIDEQYYNPDSIIFTKNGVTFTPTQSTSDASIYTFEIPFSAEPLVLEITAVPCIGGYIINGVSSTVFLSPDNQTEYYQFLGLVGTLPSNDGYLVGDSCFLESQNCIYVYDGASWVTFASSAIDDNTKMTILSKAEKTAFQFAVEHGLSQDYGYFDVLFSQYVYARNIGAETITLAGDNGKLVGGDYTTLDSDGYLVNKGAYVDSTGLARFTMAMLNNCNIKGSSINVLSITGELINDVLTTHQKSSIGTAVSVGSMASQNYYLGSQAKAKLKALVSSDNTIYAYSGVYAGKSFTKVVKKTSSMPDTMANYITVVKSLTITSGLSGYTYVWGNGRVLAYDSYAEMKVTTDGSNWVSVSSPIYNTSRSASFCVGYGMGMFWAYTNSPSTAASYKKVYSSTDGITWTEVATVSINGNNSFLADINWRTIGNAVFLETYYNGYYTIISYAGDYWSYPLSVAETQHWNYFYESGTYYGVFYGSGTSWKCYLTLNEITTSFTTPSGTTKVWYCSGYVYAYNGSTIYYGAGRPSGSMPSSWTALATVSSLTEVTASTNTLWAYYDSGASAIKVYKGLSLMLSYSVSDFSSFRYINGNNLYYVNSAKTALYQISITSYGYQNGLNFLNDSKFLVAYESQMGDYIQSQNCTLNNGSTSLLNLPSTIPSGMDFYRRIPTLYNSTAVYLSIASIKVEAYTRFDTSINAEVYMSEITSAYRVDTSPATLMVDNVEKLSSGWYIKNKTSLTATFTPNTKAAGVETGDLNPMDEDRTIGAVTPYKAVRTKQLLGLFPVGSVYLTVGDTNPKTLFGGEWVKSDSHFTADGSDLPTVYIWRRTS